MGERRHRLPAGHLDYGTICPSCAAPKSRQSMRCADCYYELRRAHVFPDPPVPQRTAMPRVSRPRVYGPQPQDHPWRKAEKLRLLRRRAA